MPAHLVCNAMRAVCSTPSPIWSRCGIEHGAGGSARINFVCNYPHLVKIQGAQAFIPNFADQSIRTKLQLAVSQVLGTVDYSDSGLLTVMLLGNSLDALL